MCFQLLMDDVNTCPGNGFLPDINKPLPPTNADPDLCHMASQWVDTDEDMKHHISHINPSSLTK